MDWISRLNEAMDYIEHHLACEVDAAKAAQIAGCSTYHFQRMFSYIAGVPLSEYLRRRRMTLAAADLQAGMRVLDAALRYGYESPTAFNRAFQSVHGVPPSQAQADGAALKAYLPLRFHIIIKGDSEMNYRIEKREAFPIVGISAPLSNNLEENFQAVPQLWGKASMDGTLAQIAALMEGPVMGVLGVSACGENDDWKYYIAVATSKEPTPPYERYMVPAATWAIFPGEGPAASLQELEKRVVTEWLPSSGYEYGQGPDIEVYISPNPVNAKYEVWIPVVKKN